MAKGLWTGFWSETGRNVAQHQKRRVQNWFMRHPTTFLLAWGGKGLVWNLPKAAWKGGRKLAGQTTKTKTVGAGETATVITNAGAKSPTAKVDYGGKTVTVIPRNITRPATAFQRGPLMQTGREMLGSTPMGHLFVAVAAELDYFTPVQGREATSTLNLMSDAYQAFLRLAGGVDMFSDVVAACNMHARVVHHLYQAVEDAETTAERMRQARRLVETIYSDRLTQEDSNAGVVNTLPAVSDGDEAAGLVPLATKLASCYMAFEPRLDEEATSILEVVKVSQAGWAVLADSLTNLSTRLGAFAVDRRVRTKVGAAGDASVGTAAAFGAARRAVTSLYRSQMAQESTGTATILTIPLGRAA
ncbi:hypothetical protein L0U85_04890 [Glycomyces sp. L485]|uniref:hypothetical protein n=1 Tax=Glycomyces sp. L485 TaxID=2909235 RepID=UPI001F4B0569|nr:hypothetical protein [Glycomyces sp. L485]MCH7230200.1 hypothetical protein [Glycomyces sp. L485]